MGTSLTQHLHLSPGQPGWGQPGTGLCSAPRGCGTSVPLPLGGATRGDVTAGGHIWGMWDSVGPQCYTEVCAFCWPRTGTSWEPGHVVGLSH